MKIGLRIDVDTFRGTREGVPALCAALEKHSIKASFYFSVGPDNMGRNLWRMLNPEFFRKMLRSKAQKLYGWDILFKGVFGQGPVIGEKLRSVISDAAAQGHEAGLHAWDHYSWQTHLDKYSQHDIHNLFRRGIDMLGEIIGAPPSCSASPAWKANEHVLKEKECFAFKHNSDCRGRNVFRPVVDAVTLKQPQIPVTLPTYDELIGRSGIDETNYNSHLLSLLKPDGLNVLTIHAEVEGIICSGMFSEFLVMAHDKGFEFVTLGSIVNGMETIPEGVMCEGRVPGRDGWIAVQR